MNDIDSAGVIRVGVKRWDGGQPAEPDGPATSQVGPYWLDVDGIRVPGSVLRYASHSFESAEDGSGFGVVTVQLFCSDYQTVDADTEAPVDALPPKKLAGA